MKKKQKIILIILATIGLTLIIIGLIYDSNHKKVINNPKVGVQKIEKKIAEKENMLIYVTEKNNDLCKETDKMIKYYEEAYGLEFYYSNKENLSNSDLVDYFELEEQAVEYPAVVYISDGLFRGVANKILSEDYFRDCLLEYGFIDKSYYENDYRITYKEFKEKFASSEKQILFFYNYGSNVHILGETGEKKEFINAEKVRKELLELSKEYNFKYRVVFYNSESSDEIYKEVITSLGKKEIAGPFIVITENNKVIDYLAPEKISSINNFLNKNGILN